MNRVLVTGASGHVGRHVVRQLQARDVDVVAVGQRSSEVVQRFGENVVGRRLDFLDPASWPDALEGTTRLFLMRPPAISRVRDSINRFVDIALEKGIEHIVFLSVAGAERNRLTPHRRIEDHLRLRCDGYTLLRPGFFAQNLESSYRDDIVHHDRIHVPAGSAQPVNWIAAQDIAEVASVS